VQRDAEDDQPDAGEVPHGGDLAQDDQADDGGGGGQQREQRQVGVGGPPRGPLLVSGRSTR
jgi:hypothetical protein